MSMSKPAVSRVIARSSLPCRMVVGLSVSVLLAACGGGGGTEPVRPVVASLARVVVTSAPTTSVVIGQPLTLTVRGESSTGVAIPGATVSARTFANTMAVGTATDGAVSLEATMLGVDSVYVTLTKDGRTATTVVPIVVRPAPGTVFQLAGGSAIEVDSSETRPVTLTATLNGAAVPIAVAPSFQWADTTRAVLTYTSGYALRLRGRVAGAGPLVLRLGSDSVGTIAVTVASSWPWRSAAYWYKIVVDGQRAVPTFLGVGARDSLLYEGLANGTTAPVRVPGLPKLLSVSGSSQTVCAVAVDRQVWCAGTNLSGEVGRASARIGDKNAGWAPVDGPERFTEVATGVSTVFAMTADGRVFGWGWVPNGVLGGSYTTGCGPGSFGYCVPVPFQPARRFDRLVGGLGICAREVGTGDWYCGGGIMRLVPGTNSASIQKLDSVIRVDLGRFGPVTYVSLAQNGSSAVTVDGRGLSWEPYLYNQVRLPANTPVRDTVVIRADVRWLQVPVVGIGIRADGIPMGFQATEQLVGVPFALSTRPVDAAPNQALHSDVCLIFTRERDAACSDTDPAKARTGLSMIPRPARP